MKDNTLIKWAAIVILAPVAVGAVIGVVNIGITGINAVSKARFNSRMKKGVKEGTIIEVDGQFYTIEQNVEEA